MLLLGWPSCSTSEPQPATLEVEFLNTGSEASLRGCSAWNDQVVWFSGTDSTVLESRDGGANWRPIAPPQGQNLDFRDLEALSETELYAMSAGPGAQSRIYRTRDAGDTWDLVYEASHSSAFLNGMAFWENGAGIAFGDAIEGRMLTLYSEDGETWVQAANSPPLTDDRHGFAASGTSIAVQSDGSVWVGTGGAEATVHYSGNRGRTWESFGVPITAGTPSSGVFSLAVQEGRYVAAAGGDYRLPSQAAGNVAVSNDGGRNWQAVQGPIPYRSAIAYLGRPSYLLATGETGVDVSWDGGRTWQPVMSPGFHTLCVSPGSRRVWLAGSGGRAARLVVSLPDGPRIDP